MTDLMGFFFLKTNICHSVPTFIGLNDLIPVDHCYNKYFCGQHKNYFTLEIWFAKHT